MRTEWHVCPLWWPRPVDPPLCSAPALPELSNFFLKYYYFFFQIIYTPIDMSYLCSDFQTMLLSGNVAPVNWNRAVILFEWIKHPLRCNKAGFSAVRQSFFFFQTSQMNTFHSFSRWDCKIRTRPGPRMELRHDVVELLWVFEWEVSVGGSISTSVCACYASGVSSVYSSFLL